MFSAKKIILPLLLALFVASGLLNCLVRISVAAPADTQSTAPKNQAAKPAEKTEKKEAAKAPEPPIENAVAVSAEELVAKPHEYLGKTIKFNANFYAFSNLALDYKPAYKSSKTHLSLLVLKPGTHIPLSELKLAMMIPKEKDPETELLAKLKDGDQLEVIGKEFSTALDDPWVEIFKIKKLGGSKDDDKKVAHDTDKSKSTDSADKDKDKEKDAKSTK